MKATKQAVSMGTTQPPDWVKHFKRAASLEGVTFSEWVGLACLDRFAHTQGKQVSEVIDQFSHRVPRGRIPGAPKGGDQ